MRFTKMHGTGNDYVYIDCFNETVHNAAALAVRVSDRRLGIGSDGLILICPSDVADCRMEMYNADGSRAQMCGNGIRCVAKYMLDSGRASGTALTVETDAGVKTLTVNPDIDERVFVDVNMGVPLLTPRSLPTTLEAVSEYIGAPAIIDAQIATDALTARVTCVSMGNPHAVVVVGDVDTTNVHSIGAAIENHPAFPERVNVHFIQPLDRDRFRIRSWERGSGETLSCGTGNCAAVVAATMLGLCDGKATMETRGGNLEVRWDGDVWLTGEAVTVFTGEV